jgi:hypothetical protein
MHPHAKPWRMPGGTAKPSGIADDYGFLGKEIL